MKGSGVSLSKVSSSCCLFVDFRRLIHELSEAGKDKKVDVLKSWIARGELSKQFITDLHLWCKLLVPQICKREFKILNKQLMRIFSELFNIEAKKIADISCGNDISTAIKHIFENNKEFVPAKCSTLTIREVITFLEELADASTHVLKIELFKAILPSCTSNDLKVIIRLIKRNLHINLGPKQLLEALHPQAYKSFKTCRDLDMVIKSLMGIGEEIPTTDFLMNPIYPMLSEPCKSLDQAINKSSNGLFAEIKYDGERAQVHKKNTELEIYARNLKPFDPNRIGILQEPIHQAFQNVDEIIIDSELILVDTNTTDVLPIGSAGNLNANSTTDVCLVVFDCIYIDGVTLTNAPLKKRRKILEETIIEIKNRVILSEKEFVETKSELSDVVAKALNAGIEGLILKDVCGAYVPGKRQWLKIKKDFLYEGRLPDSADLIVLGAWFGTGKYHNLMARFLMGCYDENNKVFVTVTEVRNGIPEDCLLRFQTELEMERIDQSIAQCPKWLYCSTLMLPDFVAKDPKKQPVWEISGVEFTQHETHTADGISLRFPKVIKFREDKTWEEATSLNELRVLVTMSSKKSVFQMLQGPDSKYDKVNERRKIYGRRRDDRDIFDFYYQCKRRKKY